MIPKIALITGGSRGLGKDMALAMARKGTDVVVTYHTSPDGAQETVREIEQYGGKAAALQFDVGAIASIDSFLEQLRNILQEKWGVSSFDFLVYNAGYGGTVPIAQMT